jgi:hypothetical protein
MANARLQNIMRHCIHIVLDGEEVHETGEAIFGKRLEDCQTWK